MENSRKTLVIGLALAATSRGAINLRAEEYQPKAAEAAVLVGDIYKQRKSRPNREPVAYRHSRVYKGNGAKECAKRLAKIAAGQLKAENGLVL